MAEYKVVGSHDVHGHKTGDTFSADFTEEEERRLIEPGHIERAERKALEPPKTKE